MTEFSGLWEEAMGGTGREPGLPRQFLPQTIRPLTNSVKPVTAASHESQLTGSKFRTTLLVEI